MVRQRIANPSISLITGLQVQVLYSALIGSWCNGSTTVSKTVDMGSIPVVPAIKSKYNNKKFNR